MKRVKFKKAGKWADTDTLVPQLVVENDGDEHEVSDSLADIIVEAGKGSIVKAEKKKAPAKDKAQAEKNPATEDKAKAESE